MDDVYDDIKKKIPGSPNKNRMRLWSSIFWSIEPFQKYSRSFIFTSRIPVTSGGEDEALLS